MTAPLVPRSGRPPVSAGSKGPLSPELQRPGSSARTALAVSKIPAKDLLQPAWRSAPTDSNQSPITRSGNYLTGKGNDLTLHSPRGRSLAYTQVDTNSGKIYVTLDLSIFDLGRIIKARQHCYFFQRSLFVVAAQTNDQRIEFPNVEAALNYIATFYSISYWQ